MPKIISDLEVVEVRYVSYDTFILSLRSSVEIPEISPGNFAEIKVEESTNVFLRRPFSILDVDYSQKIISFLIKTVGEGTRKLGGLRRGQVVNVIYPLGNSFSLPVAGERVLLVGGGSGLAPFVLLGKALSQNQNPVTFLVGGKSKRDVVSSALLQDYGDVFVTTEDGSAGERGLVTDHSIIKDNTATFDRIYSCGPEPMMRAVAGVAQSKGIECEVSLENLMACGFGVCLCCVTPTTEGNLRVCADGPVFNTKRLKW